MASVYDGLVSRLLNRRLSRPIARLLTHTPVTPNQVSFASLSVAAASFTTFAVGLPILGGLLAQASSIVDGVDGDLARMKQKTSAFGGFLDAILDRYADALIILGLLLWATRGETSPQVWIAGFCALTGSLVISYTRARIVEAPPTLFDRGVTSLASRDVRLLIIMFGGILGLGYATLLIIAVLTHTVVVLRLLSARRVLSGSPRPADEDSK